MKSLVSLALILTSLFTWSAPALALRQEQKAQTGLEELELSLASGNPADVGPALARLAGAVVAPRPPAAAPSAPLRAGLEERNLDELLKAARPGMKKEDRLAAIAALGIFFSETRVETFPIVSFGKEKRRLLPDLTPVTANGALGVVLGKAFGSGDKKLVDETAARQMAPTARQAFQIAGWNWWNKLGEGKRDDLALDQQIPPMDKPVIFHQGWPTAETANDPVDGTTLTSKGKDGGVNIFMVTPNVGFPIPDELRVEYVVYTGRKANFSLKRDPYEVIFRKIAAANGRSPRDYEMWPLNRPHHRGIIEAAKSAGIREEKIRPYQDGSVQPPLYMAAFPQRHIILAGRVGATEAKLIPAPLRNVQYADGGRVWIRARIISENSGFEVEQKVDPDDGTVYYEPKKDEQGEKIPAGNLDNGDKLSLRDIRALREAGYTEEQIQQIQDRSLEFDIEQLAPAAGDIFLTYMTPPMKDIKGNPLYDWVVDVRGVHQADGTVSEDTLQFTATGARIVRITQPDRGLEVMTAQLSEQYRVVNLLHALSVEDKDTDIQQGARQALQAFLPHAIMADLQRQAAQGIAGVAAGLEEQHFVPVGQSWVTRDGQFEGVVLNAQGNDVTEALARALKLAEGRYLSAVRRRVDPAQGTAGPFLFVTDGQNAVLLDGVRPDKIAGGQVAEVYDPPTRRWVTFSELRVVEGPRPGVKVTSRPWSRGREHLEITGLEFPEPAAGLEERPKPPVGSDSGPMLVANEPAPVPREMAAQQMLFSLNELGHYLVAPADRLGASRAILVDAAEDPRLGRLAQALSVMMSKDKLYELEFRLIIQKEYVPELIRQLRVVNPEAADHYLSPRIVPFDGTTTPYDEAYGEALKQLASHFGFRSIAGLQTAGILRPFVSMTGRLALELEAFFREGGLQFVSGEALERLQALLEAA
ncbi:MAG: fructose-bisphosphatase class II [Candidatus Omnitrophica bacterium]|nr:fructose-bisphosphatase class II [Candidatus Omnitrophota bacterium]